MPVDHGDPIDREVGDFGDCDSSPDPHSPIGDHYSADDSNYYNLDPSDPEYDNTPGSSNRKKGYCWKICPFSTQWASRHGDVLGGQGLYRTQTPQPGGDIEYVFKKVPGSEQTNHTRTGGRMRFQMRGNVTGWICDDLACYYYTTEDPGKKFFLV